MQKLMLASVVGARPNFMKIAPIAEAIRRYNDMNLSPQLHSILIHTGQHYDRGMSELFFEELGIPAPDYELEVGSSSHARQTAEIMIRIEPVLLEVKPDYLLVVGDVNSTIASALTAKKMGIMVVHVEAGLRSFDETMPEEINRILTDAISDLLFTTEREATANLIRQGVNEQRIYFVGNVMVDTLLRNRERAERSDVLRRLGLSDSRPEHSRYALLTLHRPANVDDAPRLKLILEAIDKLSSELPVVFPVHPRTAERIAKIAGVMGENIIRTAPLGYLDFLKLMAHAAVVLTDSGGIQEETTVLGVPCLTLRENTERPVTISEGTNRLVGANKSAIIAAARDVLNNGLVPRRVPELWDGKAARRVVEAVCGHARKCRDIHEKIASRGGDEQ